jgi:hypothetical protein
MWTTRKLRATSVRHPRAYGMLELLYMFCCGVYLGHFVLR